MTDLSSEPHPEMANMAGELIQAKMDMARQNTQMTHVLRMGPFHMEVVPSKDIDIEKMFKNVMDDLYKKTIILYRNHYNNKPIIIENVNN